VYSDFYINIEIFEFSTVILYFKRESLEHIFKVIFGWLYNILVYSYVYNIILLIIKDVYIIEMILAANS